MISIIVPIYNASHTIKQCVDSITDQSYNDFEIILVDDGSNDDSLAICNDYAANDSRIKVIHKAQNQGVSMTRNIGIDHANGKYVTFIDADDWIDHNHLSNMISAIGNSQLCIVDMQMHQHGQISTLGIDDKTITDKAELIKVSRLFGSTCNALFETDIIISNGIRFDAKIAKGEDTDFLMQYIKYTDKVVVSSMATYHYLMPDSSKQYKSSNLLYSTIKLYENMISLTSRLNSDEKKRILEEECREDIDWAIEGLFYYPTNENEEENMLLEKFSQYFYPHLGMSFRNSVRHRIFKRICISKKPNHIMKAAKIALWINQLGK